MTLCSMLRLPAENASSSFIRSLSSPNKLTGNSAEKLTPPNALLQLLCSMQFSQERLSLAHGRRIFSQIY